jgi:hypothetical protein
MNREGHGFSRAVGCEKDSGLQPLREAARRLQRLQNHKYVHHRGRAAFPGPRKARAHPRVLNCQGSDIGSS